MIKSAGGYRSHKRTICMYPEDPHWERTLWPHHGPLRLGHCVCRLPLPRHARSVSMGQPAPPRPRAVQAHLCGAAEAGGSRRRGPTHSVRPAVRRSFRRPASDSRAATPPAASSVVINLVEGDTNSQAIELDDSESSSSPVWHDDDSARHAFSDEDGLVVD